MRRALPIAKWIDCPGIVNDGHAGHAMRDYCWSCAPWWGRIAVCPHCEKKLRRTRSGDVMCDGCRQFCRVAAEER